MNCTACRETKCRQAVHKLFISLHSKYYRLSGKLIHWQNSYAPRSRRCTGRREAQSSEPVKKDEILFVHKFKKTLPSMPVS
jgi:hypothetical protein